MNADIGTLLVDVLRSSSGLALLAVGGGSGGLLVELVVGVVDKILFSRHVGRFLVLKADATGREKQRNGSSKFGCRCDLAKSITR